MNERVFDRLAASLTGLGLPADWYVVPNFTGVRVVAGDNPVDVYCVEALLGASHSRPGYQTYAVAQAFVPQFPSLALLFVVERRESDEQPSDGLPEFDADLDRKFSTVYLPTMNVALNELDPTGRCKGLLVQAYHSKMTPSNFARASVYSWQLLRRFKRDGQLAQIAVDYSDPLVAFIASVMRPLMFLVGGDVHMIRRTPEPSTIEMPIRNPAGGYFLIRDNSTALDQGLRLACSYLERHYQMAGLTNVSGALHSETQ
jgi:hypothetical protein